MRACGMPCTKKDWFVHSPLGIAQKFNDRNAAFCLGDKLAITVRGFGVNQAIRITAAPAAMNATAARRLEPIRSFRINAEMATAMRIEVSRNAATAATGAMVIAQRAR